MTIASPAAEINSLQQRFQELDELPACLLVAAAITFGIEKPAGPWLKKKLNYLLIEKVGGILRRIPFLNLLNN